MVRIYSVGPPSHPSSNAYHRCCSCRSKPNENSQFPRASPATLNRWFSATKGDGTKHWCWARGRDSSPKVPKCRFPDTDREIIPNGTTSSKSRFLDEFPPKRFDDCPSHFAVNVRIFPYIRIVSILATLIYSCCACGSVTFRQQLLMAAVSLS